MQAFEQECPFSQGQRRFQIQVNFCFLRTRTRFLRFSLIIQVFFICHYQISRRIRLRFSSITSLLFLEFESMFFVSSFRTVYLMHGRARQVCHAFNCRCHVFMYRFFVFCRVRMSIAPTFVIQIVRVRKICMNGRFVLVGLLHFLLGDYWQVSTRIRFRRSFRYSNVLLSNRRYQTRRTLYFANGVRRRQLRCSAYVQLVRFFKGFCFEISSMLVSSSFSIN